MLIIIFISSHSFAQNTSSKDAKKLKTRTLIVGLEELSSRKARRLKGNELDIYKIQIEGNNNTLKKAIEKHWSFNKNIKYLPLSEAEELMKKNRNEYAILRFSKYTDYEVTKLGAGWSRDVSQGIASPNYVYKPEIRYRRPVNEIMTVIIEMPSTIVSVNLPNIYVSEADAVYGIKQMDYILNKLYKNDKTRFRDIIEECNGNILKKKTLLLCEDDLHKNLNDEAIRNIYPHKFKIASIEEINKAIIEQSDDFVIIQIVSVQGGKKNVNVHFLYETNTGKTVGLVAPSIAFGIKGTGLIKYNERIKKKQLSKYSKISNCK